MAFIMNQEELESFPTLDINLRYKDKIYIENKKTLIKQYDEIRKYFIDFLVSLPENNHIIKPTENGVILDSKNSSIRCCYRMKFLNDAKSLLTLYKSSIPYEDRIKYANQLFSALQFLHQYIVVGDIHSENILISCNNAYLIDLDGAKLLSEKRPIECQYYINFLRSYGNTKQTDVIKLYLECLSFILGINFYRFIAKYGYKEFYKIITSHKLPTEVLEFFKLSDSIKFKKLGDEAYNLERFMSPDILELKRTLSFFESY